MTVLEPCPTCQTIDQETISASKSNQRLFQNRSIVRCKKCLVAFLSPMPSDESLTSHYSTGADWDHRSSDMIAEIPIYKRQAEARLNFITRYSTVVPTLRFLDVGAGFGALEKLMRENWPAADIHAIEPDQQARQRLTAAGFHSAASLAEIDVTSFDLIVISHVLEHVPQPIQFLKALRPRLSANGTVFIEVPNEDFRFKTTTGSHIIFFNPATLTETVRQAGFEIISIGTCGPDWQEQKKLNEKEAFRLKLKQMIPFKTQLRRLWRAMRSSDSGVAAGDAVDAFDRYGEDRVWIRCLAKPVQS